MQELSALGLTHPPGGTFPKPPVQTAAQTLPFGELSWENFERLSTRLAARSGQVEGAERYGRAGQAQQGIDIFARKPNGRYEVWQAKRYRTFTAKSLKKAVEAFLAGTWADRSDALYLAVQAALDDTDIQEQIETQRTALAARDITFIPLGGERLADRLRPHQDLVLSFFGRTWLTAFYGDAVDPALAQRLDGPEFAKVRDQLAAVYRTRFLALDPGVVSAPFTPGGPAVQQLGLLDRYAVSDVLIRERHADARTTPLPRPPPDQSLAKSGDKADPFRTDGGAREELRRVPVTDWLADGEQIAMVADAGAGKSTLLRCVALDLLGGQTVFPKLCGRWGERLPILVSFARWARATEMKGGEVGLKELVNDTLQPLLTADLTLLINRAVEEQRVVLLVDGLDEWSAEQSARVAFNTLVTFVGAHSLPVIVSGRPNGLRKIGALPLSWKSAELAPLSTAQQRQLALTWFHHLRSSNENTGPAASSAAQWEADRLLRELKADGALGELAATPLLLMGLLTLAMRQLALPSNRAEALKSLIQILLEIHPEKRATAAGDVKPRFHQASKVDVRQSAVAALAFASRRDGGDGGYARDQAKAAITAQLAQVNGLDTERADGIADEILAVNAETVGLLIEKAPGEIGFAHASLEEFLSAIHIQSWPLTDLLDFVSSRAGDPRWRNVIRNLVALNSRPNEVDDIIAALENAPLDVIGGMNRRGLLAEVAFSPSAMRPVTAQRIGTAILDAIEDPTYERERINLAEIAVSGLGASAISAEVSARVRRWAPRHLSYTENLINATGLRATTPELADLLLKNLSNEDSSSRRAAARTLAMKFKADDAVRFRVQALIATGTDLASCIAAIEALVLGWPDHVQPTLIEACCTSRLPQFKALGLWMKVQLNQQQLRDLGQCLRLLGEGSELGFGEKEYAEGALLKGWPSNARVVKHALESLDRRHDAHFLPVDVATFYLMRCTPDHLPVREWVLTELDKDHPFIGLWSRDWDFLVPFAETDERIREKIIRVISSGKHKYSGREYWLLLATIKDNRLRDYAIAEFRGDKSVMQYWCLLPLVEGWSSDPVVQALFADVVAMEDDKLHMLVALLPRLYADKTEARQRLLKVVREQPKARLDLILRAFQQLECAVDDDEVVQAVLAALPGRTNGLEDNDLVFIVFGPHPDVRALAMERLKSASPPYYPLAFAYPDEAEISSVVSDVLTPATTSVRYAVVTAAGTNADRFEDLNAVLGAYSREIDFDLKVQLAVYNAEFRRAQGRADDVEALLLDESDRTGIDYEEMRGMAFAGLMALGKPERILETKAGDRLIRIGSILRRHPSSTFCTLLVKNWAELKQVMGDDFISQKLIGSDETVWPALSRFVGPDPIARQDFLAWCEESDQIGTTALNSLADLNPRSDVLRKHVMKILQGAAIRSPEALPIIIAAARIARDQFLAPELVAETAALFEASRDSNTAIVLAIFDRDHASLKRRRVRAITIGRSYRDWLTAVCVSALLDAPEDVVGLIKALSERRAHPGRQHQPEINRVLIERAGHDPLVVDGLREFVSSAPSKDVLTYAAGLLAASGLLDETSRSHCSLTLEGECARDGLPTVVFDGMVDAYRPLAHTLMDILSAPTGL